MSNHIDRRQCIFEGASGLLAGLGMASSASSVFSAEPTSKPVRLGLIGLGPRGKFLASALSSEFPGVTVEALCELKPELLEAGIETVKEKQGHAPVGYCKDEYEYRKMFEREDLDGIVVATGVQKLTRISIDAMKAGKHVGSEVCAPYTLEECWKLVEEKERTGKHYMLLEQCCYGDENLMMLNMIQQGLFGEPYHGECSYIHSIKGRFVNQDQTLSWRGRMMATGFGSSYPAHGIASISKWMGINDGDRLEYCSAMMSEPREIHAQVVEQFGADSEAAKIKFLTGDFLTTMIKTVKGKTIRVDYSLSSTRPYSRYYLLQGMQGCFDSRTGIYIQGISPEKHHGYGTWSEPETFKQKYRHPYWVDDGEMAAKIGGHDGMEYFCLRDFIDMIRYDREPWVDCYDAASWGAINQCSEQSIANRGAPVEIPDFTNGRWKQKDWRARRPSPALAVSG